MLAQLIGEVGSGAVDVVARIEGGADWPRQAGDWGAVCVCVLWLLIGRARALVRAERLLAAAISMRDVGNMSCG
jgi:hypothetical protein